MWTLNFYVIEMTSKFLPDCDLLVDSVISANNLLKRTNDLELFYMILNVSDSTFNGKFTFYFESCFLIFNALKALKLFKILRIFFGFFKR